MNTIGVSNDVLAADQNRRSVGPDLGPKLFSKVGPISRRQKSPLGYIYLLSVLFYYQGMVILYQLGQCMNFASDCDIRGAFGKFLAWPFISVTDLQTISCLISFKSAILTLCYGTNFTRIFKCRHEQTYCEYMYCLYTGKRKISVKSITFYLLKSVHNINNSSWK